MGRLFSWVRKGSRFQSGTQRRERDPQGRGPGVSSGHPQAPARGTKQNRRKGSYSGETRAADEGCTAVQSGGGTRAHNTRASGFKRRRLQEKRSASFCGEEREDGSGRTSHEWGGAGCCTTHPRPSLSKKGRQSSRASPYGSLS